MLYFQDFLLRFLLKKIIIALVGDGMHEINMRMISIYYALMMGNSKTEPTLEQLFSPSDEILSEASEIMNQEIVDIATRNTEDAMDEFILDSSEELEEDVIKERYNFYHNQEIIKNYINVLESVLIFSVIYPSACDEKIINGIIHNNTVDVIYQMIHDKEYFNRITKMYLYYLVCSAEGYITSLESNRIFDQYSYIWNLCNNRGHETICDLIRNTIIDLYKDISLFNSLTRVWQIVDDAILKNARPKYFSQNGIDVESNDFYAKIKPYIIRTIIADAYADLKLDELEAECNGEELNNDELEAISYIEELQDNEVMLPSNFALRKVIYAHFVNYNMELNMNKEEEITNLSEEQKEKMLNLNPITCLEYRKNESE